MTFAQIMDFAILGLLAATVVIGFKLTLSLRNFRESRFEMEGLLSRLTANIEHAENAIGGLQNAAKGSGVQLQAIINDSRFLVDELKFMNEAGDSLADRLEKLAERNREMVEKVEQAGGIGPQSIQYHAPKTSTVKASMDMDDDDMGGFMIQDREFDDEIDEFDAMDFGGDEEPPQMQSQAERELFEALSRKSRKSATGRA